MSQRADGLRPDMLPIRVRVTPWAIRIGHEMHRFESLSQMGKWLRSNPVDGYTVVTLYRNDRQTYTGVWDKALCPR